MMKNIGTFFLWAMLIIGCVPFVVYAAPAESGTGPTQCSGDPQFVNVNSGPAIISAIFGDGTSNNPGAFNTILNAVSGSFYSAIAGQLQTVVLALIALYLTIYGIMVMFNLVQINTHDVMIRMFRIGILFAMVFPFGGATSGWAFFYQWVGGFFSGGMNELITEFAQAGVQSGTTPTPMVIQPGVHVNPGVMQALVGPIGQVFSAKFITIIMALMAVKDLGPVLAFFVIWALIDFIFMVLGAMATYLKSVVALAFLFGIAPIFFMFLLFDKTRQVFTGWLNQVVAFSVTPVLLFAFLAFYCQLISGVLSGMMNPSGSNPSLATGYCWGPWFSLPGLWDIWWWMPQYPATSGSNGAGSVITGGNCIDPSTGAPCVPIEISDILYFLLLCHLGKEFCKFIGEIAADLTNASGPGIVSGGDMQNWFKQNVTGGKDVMPIAAGVLTAGVAAGRKAMEGKSADMIRPSGAGSMRTATFTGYGVSSNRTGEKIISGNTLVGVRSTISNYMFNNVTAGPTHGMSTEEIAAADAANQREISDQNRELKPKDPSKIKPTDATGHIRNTNAELYTATIDRADQNIQAALTRKDASGHSLLDKYNATSVGSHGEAKVSEDIRNIVRSSITDAAHTQKFNLDDKQVDDMVNNVSAQMKLAKKDD